MVLEYCMERDLLGLSLLSPAYEGKTYQVAINYLVACELFHFYSSVRRPFSQTLDAKTRWPIVNETVPVLRSCKAPKNEFALP